MQWTVSRRIIFGFSLILFLSFIMFLIAFWALSRTSEGFELAIHQREKGVIPALRVESELRAANNSQLRYMIDDSDVHLRTRDSLFSIVQRTMIENRDSSINPEQKRAWESVIDLVVRWDSISAIVMQEWSTGNRDRSLEVFRGQVQPLIVQIDRSIGSAVSQVFLEAEESADSSATIAIASQRIILFGSLFILLGGVVVAYFLNRAISRPLQQTSSVLASGAAEILAAATEQASGANETLAAVSQTVATVDEVSQTAAQAAERAQGVADTARRAAEIGVKGRQSVEDSIAGMNVVREQAESIGRNILSLAGQAQAIGDITSAVNNIAEQTNLLALNAAVEAARAGEAGRGFAVVAGEIKNLSEQSKRSTAQVRQILTEIQRSTNSAVMAIEQGNKQINVVNKQVVDAGGTIRGLVAAVNEAAQSSAQIVASAGQQALGMEQIRQAIASIHEATQQNLTGSRQSEQAARDLNLLGSNLIDLVGKRPQTRRRFGESRS